MGRYTVPGSLIKEPVGHRLYAVGDDASRKGDIEKFIIVFSKRHVNRSKDRQNNYLSKHINVNNVK